MKKNGKSQREKNEPVAALQLKWMTFAGISECLHWNPFHPFACNGEKKMYWKCGQCRNSQLNAKPLALTYASSMVFCRNERMNETEKWSEWMRGKVWEGERDEGRKESEKTE